jgi:hypothetical protein
MTANRLLEPVVAGRTEACLALGGQVLVAAAVVSHRCRLPRLALGGVTLFAYLRRVNGRLRFRRGHRWLLRHWLGLGASRRALLTLRRGDDGTVSSLPR